MTEHLSPETVRDALLSYAEEEHDWDSFSALTNDFDMKPGSQIEIPGLGTVTLVDFQDYDYSKNYSGWHEQLWQIWKVGDTLYRAVGTYTSFVGTEWEENMDIVVPKEKTVTYYGKED
jgi:hypothetical protein